MPLLVQADLERKLRVWFYWLINASQPDTPTGKPVLGMYISTVDRMIRVDEGLLQNAVQLAARYDKCSEDDVIHALERASQTGIARGRRAKAATHVLEALVARMAHQSQADDRVRIDRSAVHVLDFLDEWFRCQSSDRQQEQPGGAPAIIVQVLTQLGEPNVVLWTVYHSQRQASVFDPDVKFLVIDDQCHYAAQPVRSAGRPDDPTFCNYPIEFAKGSQFDLKRSDNSTVLVPARPASVSDRVIAISPGYQSDIAHILTADPKRGPSCADQVAQDYKYWIVSGLHQVQEQACQQTLESDLQSVPPAVSIHVEISDPRVTPWFQQMLRRYVNSVGINIDDIERLVQQISSNAPPRTCPPAPCSVSDIQDEYFLRLALWLACELNLERVYVHGLRLDYIVRRCASDDEMHQEVCADLLAKTIVTNRARGAGASDRPSDTLGMSTGNLEAFIEVCHLRAFPVQEGWATLERLPEFERVLDRGWFDDKQSGFRVAVVPVALFRLDPGDLMFVGAGDTASAVSFVFGCFTTQGLKC